MAGLPAQGLPPPLDSARKTGRPREEEREEELLPGFRQASPTQAGQATAAQAGTVAGADQIAVHSGHWDSKSRQQVGPAALSRRWSFFASSRRSRRIRRWFDMRELLQHRFYYYMR